MNRAWLARHHRGIFFAGLYLAYVAILVTQTVHDRRLGHTIIQWTAPALELGLVWLACLGVRRSRVAARPAGKLLYVAMPLLASLIYASQMYSLHLSGNVITVLAMENRAESWIIRKGMLLDALAPAAAWWLVFVAGFAYSLRQPPAARATRAMHAWALAVAMLACLGWLFHQQRSTGLLQANYRQSPITSLARTAFDLARTDESAPWSHWFGARASAMTATGYPLQKKNIYASELPFARSVSEPRFPNVIVIFMEGTSTRLLGTYGGSFAGLTPAMDRLATRSMKVTQYYNHTAATYRGLLGQLVSGYPSTGGDEEGASWQSSEDRQKLAATRYLSLPLILRENGYRAYFMSPHHDSVGLNTMLRSLSFDKVFSFEDVSNHIAPGNPFYAVEGALSDDDMFHALQLLMERGSLSDGRQPFFLGMYNFGTHAFLDVMPFGQKYGDGSNAALNKLHNLDHAIGQFLDYFLASPYAKNTVLVLTTDHATFPETPYRAVAGPHYQPFFVDTIPLVIYDPVHALPATFDAHGRTSIDFAPTLLHLLGVKYGDNAFMGRSLFDPPYRAAGLAAIGGEFFATDTTGVHPEGNIPAKDQEAFEQAKREAKAYYQLELQNRIAAPSGAAIKAETSAH